MIKKIIIALRSPRGRDTMMFMLFVVISTILWSVMSLGDEQQYDVRLPLKITHIPDSVTLISLGPDALSVSMNVKGSQLLKMAVGQVPTVNIDFRGYRSKNMLHLSSADLKGIVRNATGGSLVSFVYPDSISIPYTSHRGFRLPVKVEVKATSGPQASLVGRPKLSVDTVSVFVIGSDLPEDYLAVPTEALRLSGIETTTTRRVKLLGPAGSRLIPDSVDITFEVEPLLFKNRKLVVEPINVPEGIKLITFPAQIDVIYMAPASQSQNGENQLKVVADYNSIQPESKNVKLHLTGVPEELRNIHLSADSAEYLIEKVL
ncbi:MAG: hypothetical protein J1F05_05700 [Muribaculaceae bacterium]|nr:hypothetical protein [Muribaculaceae bacterium]